MDQQTVANLSGTALEYAFAKAMKYEVMGSESGPFALHAKGQATVHVFGDAKSVVHSSFMTDLSYIALDKAEELGAALYFQDGLAKCELQGVSVTGNSYIQALLRAIVMHISSSQN